MMDMNQKIILILTIFALLFLIYGQSFEGFANPDIAPSIDVASGSSDYYNWGYKEIPDNVSDGIPHTRHHCHRCKNPCYIPTPYRRKKYPCPFCQTKIHVKNIYTTTGGCPDITKSPDIDKYVLKSSVPACPDMSQFVKKSSMKPDPNNGNNGTPENCPSCPICPICPQCPGGNGGGNGGGGGRQPQTGPNRSTLRNDYQISSDSRMSHTGFGYGGDEDPGPGYRTGTGTQSSGNNLGLDVTADFGTTPKGGAAPDPYFRDFAYNNRGSGRIRAYNSFWNVFK
jgi:hypothetical protein